MVVRKYALAAAGSVVALGLFLGWLWQPERQVRLHTSHFLKKVEQRDWKAARNFLADDYTDRWDHDPETAVADARLAFGSFLFLTIENRLDSCVMAGNRATTQATLKISGRGGPVGELVMERVNLLRGPFTLTWRRIDGKPWNWKLTSVDHPELRTERFEGL